MTKRKILYWVVCILYGVVLTGVLLYLRFPAEKFLRYCEHRVEKRFPGVDCTIGDLRLEGLSTLVFHDVRLSRSGQQEMEIVEDAELRITPQMKNPFREFTIVSRAYGGHHQARVKYNAAENSLILTDVSVEDIDMAQIGQLQVDLGRQLEGQLQFTGDFQIGMEPLQLVEAQGKAVMTGGTFGLKKPILELTSLDIEQGEVDFTYTSEMIELQNGKVKSLRLNTTFQGSVQFVSPWPSGTISLNGDIEPLDTLYQGKKQLKTVVARMQRIYKTSALPFEVNGTIGRPTFRFGR